MNLFRLSFTSRNVTRQQWRAIWRQLRIVNRETGIAWQDAFIFGTGYIETGPEVPEFIRRVHPSNVAIPMMDARR